MDIRIKIKIMKNFTYPHKANKKVQTSMKIDHVYFSGPYYYIPVLGLCYTCI